MEKQSLNETAAETSQIARGTAVESGVPAEGCLRLSPRYPLIGFACTRTKPLAAALLGLLAATA